MSFEILYIPSGTIVHFYRPHHAPEKGSCTLVPASEWFEKVYRGRAFLRSDALEVRNKIINEFGNGDDGWRKFHSIALPMLYEDFEIVEINNE